VSTEFEKTIPTLARPTAKHVPLTLAAAVAACLIFGLLAAVYYQAWAAVAILFVGVAALLSLLVLQFGELYRFATGKRTNFAWTPVDPDVQRQMLSTEIEQIAKHLRIGEDEGGEVLSTYVVAQDLALRQVQQEYKAAMIRHANVGRVAFDALIPGNNRLTCVDVSFLVTPELRQDKIDAMLKKIAHLSNVFETEKIGLELRLIVVLVTQLDSDAEAILRSTLRQKRFSSTTADIDIRIFDFEDLQRAFLSE
jgi:hypothetical protein